MKLKKSYFFMIYIRDSRSLLYVYGIQLAKYQKLTNITNIVENIMLSEI